LTRSLLVPELLLEPGGAVRAGLAVELADGKIGAIVDAPGAGERSDVVRLPERLLIPGLVNGHSHAFQRHLRGRVEVRAASAPQDDFWSWREAMYAAAEALDPSGMREVAEECFDAGRRAGYTTVGEFHYVHHRPDGTPYEEPNELALEVIAAARNVGVRIVLLMAAYARAGAGRGPTPEQRRFCDPSAEAYLDRVERLAAAVADDPLVTVGYAPHSLRAVPRDWLTAIAAHASETGYPVHIHAAEQPREVEESVEEFGLNPIEHLYDCGLLGDRTTVVHATHVLPPELDLLAATETTVCACPTTEANLGDGFLPAEQLWQRGVRVSFGADSNVRLDPFEEARETEGCARRQSGRRNVLVSDGDAGPALSLWRCLTVNGAHSLGLAAPGIAAGAPADLAALDLRHPEIRGVAPGHLAAAVLFSGTGALVRETWVAGAPSAAAAR
jgi:formimidoylglutamate deiminase